MNENEHFIGREKQRDGTFREVDGLEDLNKFRSSSFAHTNAEEVYRKIDDINKYIKITYPLNVSIAAKKNGYITARMAEAGEKISVMTADGKEEAQEVAKPGDWVATRVYEDGTPHVDEHGNTNSWLMSADTLVKKYNISQDLGNGEAVFAPKGKEQKFMCVSENIALSVPWGENGAPVTQYIKEGGWLNITNRNDVYGVAEQEFAETYDCIGKYCNQIDADWFPNVPDHLSNAGFGNPAFYDYDEKVDLKLCQKTMEKFLDRARSEGIELSDLQTSKGEQWLPSVSNSLEPMPSLECDATLKNGIKIHLSFGPAIDSTDFTPPETGEAEISAYWEERNPLDQIKRVESIKVLPYEKYLENIADKYFPEEKTELMEKVKESGLSEILNKSYDCWGDNTEIPSANVSYLEEPDRETAGIIIESAKDMANFLEGAKSVVSQAEHLEELPRSSQAERVALLKDASETFRRMGDIKESLEDSFDYGPVSEAMKKGRIAWSVQFDNVKEMTTLELDDARDTIHEMTNTTANELFNQLSADTQGVTHDEVQKNFDKYEIPGLDSVQYLTDNQSSYYDLVQLTLSDNQYFNADVMRIPAGLIDNLPSALAAAAKYSQTQEEFEEECPDVSYEKAYHDNPEENDPENIRYKECTKAFEPLGDARTDDDIAISMYAAGGQDAYMHAVEVLDDAGIEGLMKEVEERSMSDQELDENEREAPEYDDDDLEL